MVVPCPVGDVKKYCPQLVLFVLNTLTLTNKVHFFQPYIFAIFTAPTLKDTGLPIPKISAVCPSTRKFWDISQIFFPVQHVKKVVSDGPGLVDFAIRLVCILFVTCPTGKRCFLRNLNNRRTVKSILLVRKLLRLVNASFSLPEWQAVKMIFLHPVPVLTAFPSSRFRARFLPLESWQVWF